MIKALRVVPLSALIVWGMAGCTARAMDPQVLVGASENRAVVLSDPDKNWEGTADQHCAQHGRSAQLRSVQQPDPAPFTVRTYLGSREMGPNKLYYFDCV
jgi:hypothetical protein